MSGRRDAALAVERQLIILGEALSRFQQLEPELAGQNYLETRTGPPSEMLKDVPGCDLKTLGMVRPGTP